MGKWFADTVVDNGRLPLFFLLVSFMLAFLFIRFSVRMIRAEVSWWPGNVTPGGMHIHHVMFGLVMVLISGFCLVAIANYDTPIANCVLASVFGVGAALMLDEFALILHLRDVYWAEEGRSSIDAVFVAFAISVLYLLGVHPIGFAGDFDAYKEDRSIWTLVVVLVGLALQFLLAMVTVLKGKLWTGLVGLFFVPLLIGGAIRLSRPAAPWARWRYAAKPEKLARAVDREERLREPVVRAKIAVQEALSGRFGVPVEIKMVDAVTVVTPITREKLPSRALTALRWKTTRRRLRRTPVWRLPAVLVTLSLISAMTLISLDGEFVSGDGSMTTTSELDTSATATLLSVIAGGMITLTGLVFTATTLAMQFGASQISVRVVPMLQHLPIMRWSIGMFLSTFVFSLAIALDLALSGESTSPVLSTSVAMILALASAFLFIALVARVGMILNSSRLLRWIAGQGRTSIVRSYPGFGSGEHQVGEHQVGEHQVGEPVGASPVSAQPMIRENMVDEVLTVRLRQLAPDGRILLAVNLIRLQRLATRWGVSIQLLPSVGEFVAQDAPLFEVDGPPLRVRPHQLTACLIFGDTHSPTVSPAAALQAVVDIALKALSPAINDPGRAVQALDHIEDLLMTVAPRVRAEGPDSSLSRISGTQRTWTDYVSIATDEIRHFSTNSARVQRRLRALFATLLSACPVDQHGPVLDRIAAMDEQITREWNTDLDARLARVPDPQGLGSERGSAGREHPLILGATRSEPGSASPSGSPLGAPGSDSLGDPLVDKS